MGPTDGFVSFGEVGKLGNADHSLDKLVFEGVVFQDDWTDSKLEAKPMELSFNKESLQFIFGMASILSGLSYFLGALLVGVCMSFMGVYFLFFICSRILLTTKYKKKKKIVHLMFTGFYHVIFIGKSVPRVSHKGVTQGGSLKSITGHQIDDMKRPSRSPCLE